jgi:hypothetical protein
MTRSSSVPSLPVTVNIGATQTTSITNPTYTTSSSTNIVTPPITTSQPIVSNPVSSTPHNNSVTSAPSQPTHHIPVSYPPSTSFTVPWLSWRNTGQSSAGVGRNVPVHQPPISTVTSSGMRHSAPPAPSTARCVPFFNTAATSAQPVTGMTYIPTSYAPVGSHISTSILYSSHGPASFNIVNRPHRRGIAAKQQRSHFPGM